MIWVLLAIVLYLIISIKLIIDTFKDYDSVYKEPLYIRQKFLMILIALLWPLMFFICTIISIYMKFIKNK